MNKLAEILQLAEAFYKRAMFALRIEAQNGGYYMPDDPEDDTSGSVGGDIDAQAEQFDIKDEELFNQFEGFMSAYHDLMDSLNIDPSHLTQESMSEAAQLIDVLNTRYERIMNNQYLNASKEYSEDFDPSKLTSFVQSVVKDAEAKLNSVAGEDIDVDEVIANQYAQEFNQQMLDKGDKNITYTGNKVQQLLEARRNWFKKLMFIKKVGKSHPEYERFERYIAGRRKAYQEIMADPERKAIYRDNVKKRFGEWYKKINDQQKQLTDLLEKTTDPKKRQEIQDKLSHIENMIAKEKQRQKRSHENVKKKMQSEGLTGALEKLRVKIKTQQSEIAKKVKAKAAQDPYFNSFKQAVQTAKQNYDNDPSPANDRLLKESISKEAEALIKYLNENQVVVQVRTDLALLYAYRDKVKPIDEMVASHETANAVSNEAKPLLVQLIGEGQQLISQYGKFYRAPIASIQEIVDILKSKL
jgi:hypothetical protein